MCGTRNPGNMKYLNIVFILTALIKYQRFSELDMDNMLVKAIYGAGFINWISALYIQLRVGCL